MVFEHLPKFRDVKRVPHRAVISKVFQRELKETHRGLQAPAMLGMRRVLKLFF